MTRHIDQQRTELLRRREHLNRLIESGVPIDNDDALVEMDGAEAELDEIAAALGKLDEVAALGDQRTYPRLKVRRVPDYVDELEYPEGRPWLITQRSAADDDTEQVLGFAPDLAAALADVSTYVAVQRFLADRLGGAL